MEMIGDFEVKVEMHEFECTGCGTHVVAKKEPKRCGICGFMEDDA